MGIAAMIITGFAGDAAGSVGGRRPNEILLSAGSTTDGGVLMPANRTDVSVQMLVPGAPLFGVASIWHSPGECGCALQLQRVFIQSRPEEEPPPLPPSGVYLFGVQVYMFGYHGSTLATAVLDESLATDVVEYVEPEWNLI